jgi:hypothetical protein
LGVRASSTPRERSVSGASTSWRTSDDNLYRLELLALDERTTVAELLRDGLNLILKNRKLPPARGTRRTL